MKSREVLAREIIQTIKNEAERQETEWRDPVVRDRSDLSSGEFMLGGWYDLRAIAEALTPLLEPSPLPRVMRVHPEFEAAKAWVVEQLKDGPVSVSVIKHRGVTQNISMKTLSRVREALGVEILQRVVEGKRIPHWGLPEC